MKLVTFEHAGQTQAGILEDGVVMPCDSGPDAACAVLEAIRAGNVHTWSERAAVAERIPMDRVTLRAPMPDLLRDVICVGKNYHAHASEFFGSGFDSGGKEELPSNPVIFTKAKTAVIGSGATILASLDSTHSVDYEGELGVVIGKHARSVARDDAYDYVAGYVIVNDVTSREIQKRHSQWVLGKGLDTFCPMGPWIATADEFGDVSDLTLETRVNGEVRQAATLRDLVFDIPTLIETITATQPLLAGDVIATGTPAGVGIGFKPPKYLVPGDSVSVAITGLGILENPVS